VIVVCGCQGPDVTSLVLHTSTLYCQCHRFHRFAEFVRADIDDPGTSDALISMIDVHV
jgi:hypothetical protein